MTCLSWFELGALPPQVWVDGVVVATPNTGVFDFDSILSPEEVAASRSMEVPPRLPRYYGGAESDCGVIVICSK